MTPADDEWCECDSGSPVVVAVIGAVGTVLASVAAAWWQTRERRRDEERERDRRLVQLETLIAARAADGEEDDSGST